MVRRAARSSRTSTGAAPRTAALDEPEVAGQGAVAERGGAAGGADAAAPEGLMHGPEEDPDGVEATWCSTSSTPG